MAFEYGPLQLVEGIAEEFSSEARQRKCQILGFSSPELPPKLTTDSEAIADVLRMLTTHGLESVDHAKDGSVLVEALTQKRQSRDQVRLGVSDSRTDVPPDEIQSVIRNLEKRETKHGKCGEVLRSIGTKLEADLDMLGRATRFFFSIPLQRVAVDTVEPPISNDLAQLKMFLVANDPSPNRTIPHYCRHAGIDIQGSPTAAETILELGRAGPHYEMLAVAPPIEDMTPAEIARQVRSSDVSNMKLLYVAPWDDQADRLAHIEAGFDDAIAKPFTKAQLFDSLRRLTGRAPKAVAKAPLILIVEDNSINAQLASFQLRRLGYESEIVTDGKQALDALTNGNHVAVLMDMQMPVMDGVEATRQIRAKEAGTGKHTVIIALTANDDKREAAMQAGCDCFLTKPASLEQLQTMLSKCIAAHPS